MPKTYLIYSEMRGIVEEFEDKHNYYCCLDSVVKIYIEENYTYWETPEEAKGFYAIKEKGSKDPWVYVDCPDVDYDPCFYTCIVKEEKIRDYNKLYFQSFTDRAKEALKEYEDDTNN